MNTQATDTGKMPASHLIPRSKDGKFLNVKFWWIPMAMEYVCMPATVIPGFLADLDSAPRGGKPYNTETAENGLGGGDHLPC